MRLLPKTLTAAGTADAIQRQDIEGEFFMFTDTQNAEILVSFDGGTPLLIERGLKIRRPFKSLTFENPNAVAVTVKFLAGSGDVEDYRTTVRPQISSRGNMVYVGSFLGTTYATSDLIESANPDRVEVIVLAHSANTGKIYLCSGTAGQPLIGIVGPGETYRLNYRGEIRAFGDAAYIGVDTFRVIALSY